MSTVPAFSLTDVPPCTANDRLDTSSLVIVTVWVECATIVPVPNSQVTLFKVTEKVSLFSFFESLDIAIEISLEASPSAKSNVPEIT